MVSSTNVARSRKHALAGERNNYLHVLPHIAPMQASFIPPFPIHVGKLFGEMHIQVQMSVRNWTPLPHHTSSRLHQCSVRPVSRMYCFHHEPCSKNRTRRNEAKRTEGTRCSPEHVFARAITLQHTHSTIRNAVRKAMRQQDDCERTRAQRRANPSSNNDVDSSIEKSQDTPQCSEHELVTKQSTTTKKHRSGRGKRTLLFTRTKREKTM